MHCRGWTQNCTGHLLQQLFSHSLYHNCGVHPGPVCFSLHDLQHSLGQDSRLSKWQNSLSHILKLRHSRPHVCIILGFSAGHLSSGRVSFPSMHIIFLFCVPSQGALHWENKWIHSIFPNSKQAYRTPFQSLPLRGTSFDPITTSYICWFCG